MKTIYMIKDLSIKTGLSVYTIKYYLKVGLIKEVGRSPDTNFRYFDDVTVDKLLRIRELRRLKEPIRTIKKKVRP